MSSLASCLQPVSPPSLLPGVQVVSGAAPALNLGLFVHELRTPLSGMMGLLELATLEEGLPVRTRRQLELVQACARQQLELIDGALDWVRAGVGGGRSVQRQVSVRALVDDLAGALAPQAHAQAVSLVGSVAENVPAQIGIDVLRLRQVVFNLLSNAIKYAPGSTVRLMVRMAPVEQARVGCSALRVMVEDDGPGMSAQAMATASIPFERAEAVQGGQPGNGLGLYLVRELVRLMGGVVQLTSAPGQGTRFDIVLPLNS